jgi:hypothetical protein
VAADQVEAIKEVGLSNGIEAQRYTVVPASGPASQRITAIAEGVMKALTTPLTAKEKKSYLHKPPEEPRIAFEGTYDDGHEFFQMTQQLSLGPVARWTDGLPIVLPTEERVREMLMGTSHSPGELIRLQSARDMGAIGKKPKGWAVEFGPMKWLATVEKVAVNAVMAGCKPEHLPVVLAIAESGCQVETSGFWSQWQVVSGPIAAEIGMNSSTGALNPGNPANAAIGRAFVLMAINLGGAMVGLNRMSTTGSPFNTGGCCIAENLAELPRGWLGLNEESGFSKKESVVLCASTNGGMAVEQFTPSSYRSVEPAGREGVADRPGASGKKGPQNRLELVIPGIWSQRIGSISFFMSPEMARNLQAFGFASKQSACDWVWKKSFLPLEQLRKTGLYDLLMAGGRRIDPVSGKAYHDLHGDHRVPVAGDSSAENIILVVGGQEEMSIEVLTTTNLRSRVFHIDPWR